MDANGQWSADESIADANVVVSSDTFGPVNLTSNILGTWRIFVPVNDTYDIFASKAGYSNGTGLMEVGTTVNTTDIEMTAELSESVDKYTHPSIRMESHLRRDVFELIQNPVWNMGQ